MSRPPNPLVRESLLNAGLALFHSRGFNAVGVKEITDTAGVPKGSFYSYYSSKNAFVAAVLRQYWTRIVYAHAPILSDGSAPPIRRVIRFFEAITQDQVEQDYAWGCLIGNMTLEMSDGNQEARKELAVIMDHWTRLVAACLAESGSGQSAVACPEPIEMASMIIESWEGATMRGRLDRSRAPYDRFFGTALPRLLGVPTTSS
ncbi:TetR family transcriptional regulator C-terminal domain-containing protein [Streptomyces sp. NPDC002309]